MVVLETDALTVGVGVTLIVIVFVLLQLPFVPLTVYDVVPEGFTVITVVV